MSLAQHPEHLKAFGNAILGGGVAMGNVTLGGASHLGELIQTYVGIGVGLMTMIYLGHQVWVLRKKAKHFDNTGKTSPEMLSKKPKAPPFKVD